MATIKAKGMTDYGYIEVSITGDSKVESVESGDPFLDSYFWELIKGGKGRIANNYHPENGSMMQAYASCLLLFKQDDISIYGDIEEMDWQKGVIY